MSRNHHVEACSLFATALSPIRGQNTSCLGFSGVQRSSMFEQMLPAPKEEPGNQVSPPKSWQVLPVPWKNTPKSNDLQLTVAPKPQTISGIRVPPMAVLSTAVTSPSPFKSLYLMSPGRRLLISLNFCAGIPSLSIPFSSKSSSVKSLSAIKPNNCPTGLPVCERYVPKMAAGSSISTTLLCAQVQFAIAEMAQSLLNLWLTFKDTSNP